MKTLKSLLPLFLILLLSLSVVTAQEKPCPVTEQGMKLVQMVWKDMHDNNLDAIKKYIAPGFLSVHTDGARDMEFELNLIKNLNMGEYKLTDFTVKQEGPVIQVVYFVSVEETIEGKKLSSTPAARQSGFLKTDDGWKWIMHANLKAIK